MNNVTRICVIAATFPLAATFVGWRVHAAHMRPVVQFEIVKDPSGSTTDGCETVIGLAEGVMAGEGVSAKSTLTVLFVGDLATANEPAVLASYPIPFSTKVVEDRRANRQRQSRVLGDLLSKCQTARATGISPIFLAVKQAIADLRGRGCNAGSRCQLLVDSDLEENVERGIRSRLDAVGRKGPPLPTAVDNSSIAVSFCGLAATKGRVARDANREDRLKSTWRSLFSAQDLVTFRPYCPASNHMADYKAEAQAASQN